jgi:hypothetical protein
MRRSFTSCVYYTPRVLYNQEINEITPSFVIHCLSKKVIHSYACLTGSATVPRALPGPGSLSPAWSFLSPSNHANGKNAQAILGPPFQPSYRLLSYATDLRPTLNRRLRDAVATLPFRRICGSRHCMYVPTQQAPLREQHPTPRVRSERDRRELRQRRWKRKRLAYHNRQGQDRHLHLACGK